MLLENRAVQALRRPANWIQLMQFASSARAATSSTSRVYTLLLKGFGVHYLAAATVLVRRRRELELLVEPPLDVP